MSPTFVSKHLQSCFHYLLCSYTLSALIHLQSVYPRMLFYRLGKVMNDPVLLQHRIP
jgi:hypothetical protein